MPLIRPETRASITCLVVSAILLVRIAVIPQYDEPIGFVASLCGVAATLLALIPPHGTQNAVIGTLGAMLALLPPLFVRA